MRRLSVLAFAMLGCTGVAGTVRDRMAADTGCAAESVQVASLPGSAYRAVGCGKVATYVCTLPNGTIACTREAPPQPLVTARVEH